MQENEFNRILNEINSKLQNNSCSYHRELENNINTALTETRIIRTEYTEANKRLANILERIEKRLDNGDRAFDEVKNDIQEIKQDIIELKTQRKTSSDWLARSISVIVLIIMALQLLQNIIHS